MNKIKLFPNYFTHKIGKKKKIIIYFIYIINFVTYRNRQLVSFTEEVWLNKSSRRPCCQISLGKNSLYEDTSEEFQPFEAHFCVIKHV